MAFLPSLPKNPHLISHVWKTFPKGVPELLAFIDVTLHGPSELTIAEREMIFAYISALNECEFCFNAHACFAEEYGASHEAVERMRDRDNPVDDPKLKPVFAYARKITLNAHTVTEADARAMLDAGWSEQGVADIIYTIGVSNMMTRVVAGFGVTSQQAYFDALRARHRQQPVDTRLAKDKASQGKPKYKTFVKSEPATQAA